MLLFGVWLKSLTCLPANLLPCPSQPCPRAQLPPRAPGESREHLGGLERPLSGAPARGVCLPRISVRGRGAAVDAGPLRSAAAARAREGRRARVGPDLFAPRRPAGQREQREQEDEADPGTAPTS